MKSVFSEIEINPRLRISRTVTVTFTGSEEKALRT
jgi:hypothetical protein